MAAFDSTLSVYNTAYTKLNTLASALLVTPELAIGVTPETAVIKQNRTNNYEVLKRNAFNYIFAYSQTLDNWNANLSENQLLISHDVISANYGIPITDPENGQPYTIGYYLTNPALQDIKPLQAPITGLPFGDYITILNTAIQIIVTDCNVDMNLIEDNQEVFYKSIYPFPNIVTGVVTNKTAMINVMKYSVGDIKYVLYWGTGINSNIPTSPVTPEAVLSVYNAAYTKLITLSSALLVTPELAIGITPETAVIKQNRTNNYEVLKGNAYEYIFAYNQTLENWNANLPGNQLIISHDIISANYGISIKKSNGQPYTVDYYLNNPALQAIKPLQAPVTGLPFGDYIRAIKDAIKIIVTDCNVDMNLIEDNQEVFYQSNYPFPNTVTGVVTNKTSMINIIKYEVGNTKYVLYWGTGINVVIPTSPSIAESTLSMYNRAYTKLNTLASALLVTPELAVSITPETAVIKENRTNNYEVLKGNAYEYIFAYNQTLNNWNANLPENQLIISHDIISANYGKNISQPNGQPYPVDYYLNNPTLQNIKPLQAPVTGLPFGSYIRAIKDAIKIIVDDCTVDMNLIEDNQEVFYQSNYPFPNVVTGIVTSKTAMINVMKYKVGHIKYVLFWGTGIQSNNNFPTNASYSAMSYATSILTYSINPDPATYLAAAQASASASASYNGVYADLNASTEATNLANSISTEEAEKVVLNYVTSSVSPNITIIQFQNSTECTTTPI